MILTFLDDLQDHKRAQGRRYELKFNWGMHIKHIDNSSDFGDYENSPESN